jgi:hypothetical protein
MSKISRPIKGKLRAKMGRAKIGKNKVRSFELECRLLNGLFHAKVY